VDEARPTPPSFRPFELYNGQPGRGILASRCYWPCRAPR